MERSQETDQICNESWDRALHAFGTAQIFLRRARWHEQALRYLSFVGVAVPVMVGVLAMAFGTGEYLPWVLALAGGLGAVQVVVSVWSIVAKWPEELQYSHESATENLQLSTAFKELGGTASAPPHDVEVRFATLKARDESRRTLDAKKSVASEEFRYGHRAGLRHFRRACSGCGETPVAMEATDCTVCGRF